MSHPQQAPWTEYRDLAESMGHSIADAVSNVIGSRVDLGLVQTYTPETMVSAVTFPQRAVVVQFAAPIRDVLIVMTSLKDELARAAAHAAATAALVTIGVPVHDGAFTIDDTRDYANLETAVDEWDALFLEASYDIALQHGDMRVVLGTGLLESAGFHRRGQADPFAEGVVREEFLGTSIGLEGDESYAITPSDAPTAPEPVSLLDQLDAELAADEVRVANEREVSAPAPVVPPLAPTSAPAPVVEQAQADRWASLLSGVEVELSAELGRTDLALGDITALDTDSVLTLDQMVNEPVTVFVNGTPYATARLVVVDGEYGIEILEVVVEQGTLTPSSLAA